MIRSLKISPLLLSALFCSLAVTMLPACSKTPSNTQKNNPPDAIYTVKGQIIQLPDPKRPVLEFQIHHEPIPNFTGMDGSIVQDGDDNPVGMNAMIMPFTTDKNMDLSPFKPNDKILFTFEVRWTTSPRMLITAIEKLPDNTEMIFSRPD